MKRYSALCKRPLGFGALLVCVSILYFLFQDFLQGYYLRTDFYSYWILLQQFIGGENPYDYQRLLEVAVHDLVDPAHFGPWTFVILTPVFFWAFNFSLLVYLVVNSIAILFGGLFFAPFWLVLFYGQSSFFVALAVFGVLAAYRSNRDYLAGALVVGACMKPQLSFLLLAALFIEAFREKRWGVYLSFGATLLGLSLISEFISPGMFTHWLEKSGGAFQWLSASLIMPIRLMLGTPEDPYPFLPAVILPLLCLWGVCFVYSRTSSRKVLDDVPYLLTLSLLFSPYIWPSDYVVLLGVQSEVVRRYAKRSEGRFLGYLSLLLMNVAFLLHFFTFFDLGQLSVYWFPIALLCLWYKAKNFSDSESAASF